MFQRKSQAIVITRSSSLLLSLVSCKNFNIYIGNVLKLVMYLYRQCSECGRSSSEESEESSNVDIDAPRRLREKIKEPAKYSRAQQDMEFLFPVSSALFIVISRLFIFMCVR